MKLVVTIEPNWTHDNRVVEWELDPKDYEGYDLTDLDDQEACLSEIAEDFFNNEVTWGWHVVLP